MFAPSVEICDSNEAFSPWMIATIAITVITPMTMPSVVSTVRSRAPTRFASAMRTPSEDLRGRADEAAPEPAHPCTTRAVLQRGDLVPGPSPTTRPSVSRIARGQRAGQFGLVGHEDDRVAAPVQLVEQPDDLVAGRGVEVAGGLVGEQERRLADQGAAIATRWRWPPESSFGRWCMRFASPTAASASTRARAPLAARDPAVDERQLHVRERRRAREQLERLEDEADLLVAHVGELVVGRARPRPRRSAGSCRRWACRGSR